MSGSQFQEKSANLSANHNTTCALSNSHNNTNYIQDQCRYLSIEESANLLNVSKRAIQKAISTNKYTTRTVTGRGGKRYEVALSSLPAEAQARYWRERQPQSAAEHIGRTDGKRLMQRLTDIDQLATQQEASMRKLHGLDNRAWKRLQAKLAIIDLLQLSRLTIDEWITGWNTGDIEPDHPSREYHPELSRASVFRWKKEVSSGNLYRLAGEYGKRKGQTTLPGAVQQLIIGIIAQYPHASIPHILSIVRLRTGDEYPETTVRRYVDNWKKSNAQALTAHSNPDKWKSEYMLAIGDSSADIVRLNQRWEIDGTPADVMLIGEDGKPTRHTLTGVIDIYSRRIRMHVSPTARSVSVGLCLRRALLDLGVPESLKHDNGSDYVSDYTLGVLRNLGIVSLVCHPFSPWEKPHIERAFRTFSHDLLELLPGFVGHNVAERSALESRKAFSDRLFKRGHAVDIPLTADEFQEFCNRWCTDVYEHREHGSLGTSPYLQAAAWTESIRTISDERALDMLLVPLGGYRRVTKSGIRIDGRKYASPEMGAWVGRDVMVRLDGRDAGMIYCYSPSGDKFLFTAIDPDWHGISRKEIATAAKIAQRRVIADERHALKEAAKSIHPDEIYRELLDDAAARSSGILTIPQNATTHTTPAIVAATSAATAAADATETTRRNRRTAVNADDELINSIPHLRDLYRR